MRPSSEPCLNTSYMLLIFRCIARGPHPEGIILIQAILEVHDIDETVCRAADHPVSGPIAAFWKADLHRQGNRFMSLVSCYCTRACMQMRVHCPLTASPGYLIHSSTVIKAPGGGGSKLSSVLNC